MKHLALQLGLALARPVVKWVARKLHSRPAEYNFGRAERVVHDLDSLLHNFRSVRHLPPGHSRK